MTETRDFHLQTVQMFDALCLFSFKSILAMASELHPWRFELEIFPSRLPCGHVFDPRLNAQQGAICEALKKKKKKML